MAKRHYQKFEIGYLKFCSHKYIDKFTHTTLQITLTV